MAHPARGLKKTWTNLFYDNEMHSNCSARLGMLEHEEKKRVLNEVGV